MTASKEITGGGASKTKKVLGTTLAGVLAVGMVPAAGIAAVSDEAVADEGEMELLDSTSTQTAFETPKSITFTDPTGASTTATAKSKLSYAIDGSFDEMAITSVELGNGASVDTTNAKKFETGVYAKAAESEADESGDDGDESENGTEDTDTSGDDGDESENGTEDTDTSGDDGDEATTTQESKTAVINGDDVVLGDEAAKFEVGETYYLVVKGVDGDYNGYSVAVAFTVKAAELTNVALYNKSTDDTENSTFTYDGTNQAANIGVTVNGKKNSDFTFNVYEAGSDRTVDYASSTEAVPNIWTAGDYVAVVTGNDGTDYAKKFVEIPFTVDALDLSKATIVTGAIDSSKTAIDAISLINAADPSAVKSELTVGFVSGKNGDTAYSSLDGIGTYTYTLKADANNKNITGSATFTFDKVTNVLEDDAFGYDSKDFTQYPAEYNSNTQVGPLTINLSDEESSFDTSEITVTAGGKELSYKKGEYTISATTAAGEAVDVDAINETPGTYIVTVTVNSAGLKTYDAYKYGGSASMYVKTTAGSITASADVFVTYDKVVGNEFSATYDGTDFLPQISVVVRDSEGNVVDADDYKVTVTTEKSGKVSEIVNADTYTIEVTSDVYEIEGEATAEFTVAPATINFVRMTNSVFTYGDNSMFLVYTGETITPVLQYTTESDMWSSKAKWLDVPEGLLKLTYKYDKYSTYDFKDASEMKEVGYYQVFVSIDEKVAGGNYELADTSPQVNLYDGEGSYDSVILVSDQKIFLDVANNAWYSQAVQKACYLGYMKGYSGANLFGPNDALTRGQLACVLFNMAGGNSTWSYMNDLEYQEGVGYVTGFSDVDGNMYYAQAIAWGKQAGVINGYAGTDEFGPEDLVTREQLACFLANYAQKVGDFEAVDAASELADYPDGSSVSDWAKENVAWAAANDIMGNGGFLNPLGNVTRAETAAMVVNYQPEAFKKLI